MRLRCPWGGGGRGRCSDESDFCHDEMGHPGRRLRMRRRGMGGVRPLSCLGVGESGVITKVEGEIPLKRRILEMGAVPGTEVVVERVAPFGDPIDVKLKGYHLSLRKEEAEKILVE